MELRKSAPLILFCLYFAKLALLAPTYTDAAILLILGATAGLFEFKSNEKKIKDLEQLLVNQQKELSKTTEEILAIKSHVASIKLATNIKSTSFR